MDSNINSYDKIVVHGGVFHADDVFTVAYVNMLRKELGYPACKILRTFSVPEAYTEKNGYLVADIGGGRFDHHFDEDKKERRENGVPYASFGLVVREFHPQLTEDEYLLLDKKFIEPLDCHDNTGCGNLLSMVISSFNKKWDSDDPNDEVTSFFKAIEFATNVLREVIPSIKSLAKAKRIANDLVDNTDGNCVFMDTHVPVEEFLIDSPIEFVGTYNNVRGGYNVMAIRDRKGHNKKLFPKEIRGLNLKGQYNSDGIGFCHKGGYLANFKSKTDAMKFMANMP